MYIICSIIEVKILSNSSLIEFDHSIDYTYIHYKHLVLTSKCGRKILSD